MLYPKTKVMQSFLGENKMYYKRYANGESNQDEWEEVKIAHKEAREKINSSPTLF